MSSSDESMLHTPVLESPESKIARYEEDLRAKEEALRAEKEARRAKEEALLAEKEARRAKEEDLRAKEEALRVEKEALRAEKEARRALEESNKQLRNEMACMKLTDKLRETMSLTTGEEDPKQIARQLHESMEEAQKYVGFTN